MDTQKSEVRRRVQGTLHTRMSNCLSMLLRLLVKFALSQVFGNDSPRDRGEGAILREQSVPPLLVTTWYSRPLSVRDAKGTCCSRRRARLVTYNNMRGRTIATCPTLRPSSP